MNDYQHATSSPIYYNHFTGGIGIQTTIGMSKSNPVLASLLQQRSFMDAKEKPVASGSKIVVVCNGGITEVDDMDKAQRVAEEQAHAKSANAYILKPVRMVAPKRDVVTTDL